MDFSKPRISIAVWTMEILSSCMASNGSLLGRVGDLDPELLLQRLDAAERWIGDGDAAFDGLPLAVVDHRHARYMIGIVLRRVRAAPIPGHAQDVGFVGRHV